MNNFFDQDERRAAKDKSLVTALAEERKRQGVSQYEMADRMETKQPALARMEKECHDPHWGTLQKYAASLGKRIAWVLEDA
jgi:DNA-binding XRE family transcriptional regulator